MLKKLVKYGNSTALVLDKAILELLGMSEGSIVKIKTDGVSLIITPQEAVVVEKVTEPLDPQATMMAAVRKSGQTAMAVKYQTQPTDKDWAEYWQATDKVIAQHQALTMGLMENPEYLKDLAILQKKYAQSTHNPEQLKALAEEHAALQKKHQPALAEYTNELTKMQQAFDEKFGAQKPFQQADIDKLIAGFREIFARPDNAAIMQKFGALEDNPEYRHELMLLSEKYQHDHSSKDYVKDCMELRYKYIPETREWDEKAKSLSGLETQDKNA